MTGPEGPLFLGDLGSRRLVQLDRVAVRIVEQDLSAAGAGLGRVAKVCVCQSPRFDRDTAMAEQVAHTRDPAAVFVGLSGNIHSRRTKGTRWNPELVPMVAQLVARGLAVTTFDVSWNGGAFWACTASGPTEPQQCGSHETSRHEPGDPWSLGPARDDSHDGVYRIGPVTAAAPAVPD